MGDMKFIPVSKIANIILGGTPKRSEKIYWNGDIHWASAKDITGVQTRFIYDTFEKITSRGLEESNTKLLPKGTIVITARGTVGEIAMLGKPMAFNQTCYGLISKECVDPNYLFYALKASLSKIKSLSYGTVFDTITMKSFDSIKVPLPSLKEQKRIAHILGTLDDKIELNQRINETLEGIARAVFQSWFVDFDPVRAKMAGEPYPLPDEIMALFPDELVESELGPIPKGWEVVKIDDEIELSGGGTPSTKNPIFWGNGIYNFATPKDMSALGSSFLIETERKVTKMGLKKISSGLLSPGTILMSSRAPVGYLAINQVPVCINQGIIAMNCTKKLTSYYMLNWANTHLEEIKARASGTTFTELSKRNFREMKILLPSEKVLNSYDQKVRALYNFILRNLLIQRILKMLNELQRRFLLNNDQ